MTSKNSMQISNNQKNNNLMWVDLLKGLAMIWIFICHAVEEVFGFPYIGNPDEGWPSFYVRITQLLPLDGYGFWNIPINIWRYIGWLGDQGVSLFLILSGFSLTWGQLKKNRTEVSLSEFYKKRFFRIYPLWWTIHIFVLIIIITMTSKRSGMIFNPNFFLSFLGIRALPSTFFYITPAWWYIGLIIQFYLLFPFLWKILLKIGTWRFIIFSCLITFVSRIIVISVGTEIGPLLYGSIFITRLAEFSFGMSFAYYMQSSLNRGNNLSFSSPALIFSILIYLAGTFLSLTWGGMIIAPFLFGTGIFCFLYGIFGNRKSTSSFFTNSISWVGKHSYSIYLVHHPVIQFLTAVNALIGTITSFIVTFFGAISLEKFVHIITLFFNTRIKTFGLKRIIKRMVLTIVLIYIIAIVIEIIVQENNPLEISGWGERPSLESDINFGWHLIPNKTTRLKWEGYDYYMTSNNLGFPGPEYSEIKSLGTTRIFTIGDAFTSAEGVNTDQSWPRLLEMSLKAKLPYRKIEVMNFAVTGYGPNQYTEIAKSFIPRYKPDIIILGFYVNDYDDILLNNKEFQADIGFGLPSATDWRSIVFLKHSRANLVRRIRELANDLRNKPDLKEYSGAEYLMRDNHYDINGYTKVLERLKQIREIADRINSKIVIFMIPVPAQVCKPNDATHYPRGYNISDTTIFDINKPQRITQNIAENLGISAYDLRIPFCNSKGSIYQSSNLHWTLNGHIIAAKYIQGILFQDKYLRE